MSGLMWTLGGGGTWSRSVRGRIFYAEVDLVRKVDGHGPPTPSLGPVTQPASSRPPQGERPASSEPQGRRRRAISLIARYPADPDSRHLVPPTTAGRRSK